MSSPAKGRADFWSPGDWNALCYQCGRKRKAGEMFRYWQGYWVCPEHWEPRQPQDFVRSVPDVQTPPWVQPPGVDGIPQLLVPIDTSADTYSVTVSTATVAAVNDTLVIVIIMEGVYIGVLDLSGLPDGWTVQVNNYGGVTAIVGGSITYNVKGKPPALDEEVIELTPTYDTNRLSTEDALVPMGTVTFATSSTLFQLAGSPSVAKNFTFLVGDGAYVGQLIDTDGALLTGASLVVGTGWPDGSVITIVVDGKVYGGAGYNGSSQNGVTRNGAVGGIALDLTGQTVYLANNGTVAAGGGGVGSGGGINWQNPAEDLPRTTHTIGGDLIVSCGLGALVAFGAILVETPVEVSNWEGTLEGLGVNPSPIGAGLSGTGGDFAEDGTNGSAAVSRSITVATYAATNGAAASNAIYLNGGTLVIITEGTITGDIS